LTPVPENLADYHRGCSCSPPDVDAEFGDQATRVVMSHLIDLKDRRDPLSRRWTTGLPVFLCGGGNGMRLFQQVVKSADTLFRATKIQLESGRPVLGLLPRTLPRAEQLVNGDIGDLLFHRLSVAYGLSFDALNIGRVSPPHVIPDLPPPRKRSLDDRFISKDQV
jgi:hypothetical protein